jgi:DNA polymerase III subunit alpha
MSFIHLHNHSHYSVLDGAIPVDKMVAKAVELGMNAVALTDHGNMCGAIEFYETAVKKGIKPLIGQEFYVAPDSRFNRETGRDEEKNHHLLIIAKDLTGYKNLMKLSSLAYTEGFYYKPRIDKELLEKHHEGLIAGSACLGGEIPVLIRKKKYDEARKSAAWFKELFGKEHYYLEVQDHGIAEQKTVNEELIRISDEIDIPLIATNDCHYLSKSDAYAHEVLLCIQTQKLIEDPDRMRFESDQFYFKSEDEMSALFGDIPDAIYNTQTIADMCDLKLSLHQAILPSFNVPEGFTLDTYLRHLVKEGAAKRYNGNVPRDAEERIEYELKVIISMGFSGYFLVVWDFINYSRSAGIPVGPGRGSAAGSIVSYCLGITQLDPLRYNLLFERFLNPDRREMPDMDIDFCAEGREGVIRYVKQKYGEDHVSQIMAYNTMQPKAAFKDVARVMNIPFAEANELSKCIREETLAESLKKSDELQTFVRASESNRRLLDTAIRLEGLVRSLGKHAAGVVISKDPLNDTVPIYRDSKDGSIATQYDKGTVEAAGLVKMDFLGLVNLTIIKRCTDLIKQSKNIDIDITTIPLDDAKSYKLLQDADTLGVFQLESSGMQSLIRKLGPTCFDDIIALLALYRPGPLQSGMVDQFIECKRHPEKVVYPHPSLEGALKDTLGVFIYQEQVMLTSRIMGGFSMSEADKLRKAMGKKISAIVDDMKDKFMKGAAEKKIDKNIAEDVYDKMAKFAEYGFNKSHSAAYGLVTYQTAFLKSHYPTEYMCALLTYAAGKQDDVIKYIADCRAHRIEVLAPDVNCSDFDFTIEGERKIRFGLRAVKGLGDKAIESIIEGRKKHGQFASVSSFLENVELSVVNKGVLESLIKSGAMMSIHANRAELFASIDIMLELAKSLQKDKKSGQGSLFFGGNGENAAHEIELVTMGDWPEHIRLGFEKEVLGLYLSGHPLQKFEKEIRLYSSCGTIGELQGKFKSTETKCSLAGVLTGQSRKTSKSGSQFAVATLEDISSSIEVMFFKKTLAASEQLIFADEPVLVTGKISFDENGDPDKMIAESLKPLREARRDIITAVHIKIDPIGLDDAILDSLKKTLSKHKGECVVYFHVDKGGQKNDQTVVKAHNSIRIKPSDELVEEVTQLIGKNSVRYTLRGA